MLCPCIYSNLGRRVVAPIYCQAFGSVGAVVAWFRTTAMIQAILEEVFKVVVLAYVDDCFWIAMESSGDPELPTAEWL